MYRTPLWSRGSATLILLLHLVVAGLGPLVDAALEHRPAEHARVHLEDADAPPCRPAHSHQYCLTCRTFGAGDLPGMVAGPLIVDRPAIPGTVRYVRAAFIAAVRAAPLGPRGPPLG